MRLALLIIAAWACAACHYDVESHGMWYNNELGFIHISDSAATYYRMNCVVPIIWAYNEENKSYLIDDISSRSCAQRYKTHEDILAKIDVINKEYIQITGNHKCFPFINANNNQFQRFSKIYKPLDFEKLYAQITINDVETTIDLDLEDIRRLNADEFPFSFEEQLWVIFKSGVDYHSNPPSHINMSCTLTISGPELYKSKTLILHPNPCILRPIMDYLFILASNNE